VCVAMADDDPIHSTTSKSVMPSSFIL
jgi:hypothetical protein